MEWNGECTKLQLTRVTVTVESRLNYLVHLYGCYISHPRSFMSKNGIAHCHVSISKHMVPLLAHHQMLCYCSLANQDSRTKNKDLALQDYIV